MCNKLPAKNIVLSNGFNINKRRRCKKEWWNEELTLLWNEVCKAEKVWIKCKIKRNKRELRHIFVNKRRIFDKAVQSSKRKYWYSLQEDLIKSCDNPKEFWRKIGKIGVGSERRSFIPMEVKLSDENNLNNVEYIHSNENVYDDYLDSFISYEEVYNVLLSSKNGKSPGCDEITVELYKNQTALLALTRIFNICFDSGKIPALWSKGIITPIPKSSTADPRDPMAYRGITLAPVSYKLYCGVLNSRLTVKLDELNFLHDEQNGFRKGRNTIDHISTLTTVIETRKLRKLSTFVAFIDFKKAYDWINRDLLFGKLENLAIENYIFSTKIELSRMKINKHTRNISAEELSAIRNLKKNNNIIIRKADKNSTLCILDKDNYLREGLRQLHNIHYEEIVESNVKEVAETAFSIIRDLHNDNYIDNITFKYLKENINTTKVGKFYLLPKIHKLSQNILSEMERNETARRDNLIPGRPIIEHSTVEDVQQFTYLGSIVSTSGGTDEDISARKTKAQQFFSMLEPVWRRNALKTSTELRIFTTNVKSVLLYGSETWRETAACQISQNICQKIFEKHPQHQGAKQQSQQ
ncbi:unnamed protein product [Mytilus edulis]|uniref:Reverse transcriptase domain-containing protein n=1 Tax=Mytilus edulis TaxID=6550 RepID=A0A8S3VRC1_MYTED|nr:unnamed protein product [Mytilus edulis]